MVVDKKKIVKNVHIIKLIKSKDLQNGFINVPTIIIIFEEIVVIIYI